MPLQFSQLLHKTALGNQANLDIPGVYIWGFVYQKDENGIGAPLNFKKIANPIADPDKHVFIPYYVGESSTSILKRLRDEHIQPRNNPSNKRTRLTMGYMLRYFNDVHFPLHFNIRNGYNFLTLVQQYQPTRVVEYFNDDKVLKSIYGSGSIQINGRKREYPINDQLIMPGRVSLNDTLDYYINDIDNFFFMYVDICNLFNFVKENNCFTDDYTKILLKKFEALTVVSLKGKTLGKFNGSSKVINSFITCPNLIFDSMINSGFDIFKGHNSLLINPAGNYNINNIAFPGYL
jgi:hypothetical protein